MVASVLDLVNREIDLIEAVKNEFLSILSEVIVKKKESLIEAVKNIENKYCYSTQI